MTDKANEKKPAETVEPAKAVTAADLQTTDIIGAHLTVEGLQKAYPELVQQIKDETVEFVKARTVSQIKKVMPELYERIAAEIKAGSGPDLSVKGFLLNIADPYAAGTLRAYQGLKKAEGLKLPYVLPYKDKLTKAAIESYILRAEGGGDIERAGAAKKALAKCK